MHRRTFLRATGSISVASLPLFNGTSTASAADADGTTWQQDSIDTIHSWHFFDLWRFRSIRWASIAGRASRNGKQMPFTANRTLDHCPHGRRSIVKKHPVAGECSTPQIGNPIR